MPRQIDAANPERSLQTIMNVATNRRGTLLVAPNTVSKAGFFRRIFTGGAEKADSVRHFQDLLTRTYPKSADRIAQLLEPATRDGRLTTGTAVRVYRQLHAEQKFRVQYPADAGTTEQKLAFEDRRALSTLTDPEVIRTVCDFAYKLADHIENSASFNDAYAEKFLNEHLGRKDYFPVHAGAHQIPKNKQGLLDYLRQTAGNNRPDKQVHLLSLLWSLPKAVGVAESRPEVQLLDRLYAVKVKEGKQHLETRTALTKGLQSLNKYAARLARVLETALGDPRNIQIALKYLEDAFNNEASHFRDRESVNRPRTPAEVLNFLRQEASSTQPDHSLLLTSFLKNYFEGALKENKDALSALNNLHAVLREMVPADSWAAVEHSVANAVTKRDTFGNTEISTNLMNGFLPHQKEREAVTVMQQPNARIQKFLGEGYPYISGFSGMTNAGTCIFPLLGESMNSEDGRRYSEALAAFIVGSGEHSYPETYKSLNLSLRYLQLGYEPPPPQGARAAANPLLTGQVLFGILPRA